ncbi:hypothetical protein [EBPR siphovirus 2]|nr:hypothetical protein [EBPR siphovirus 2]
MSYQNQLRAYVNAINKHGHEEDCGDTELLDAVADRLDALEAALKPLVKIADRYDDNGLDECRPDWGGTVTPEKVQLFHGRGGCTLLTLADCFKAREVCK